MTDRLAVETTHLPNGITLYEKPDKNVEFAMIRLIFPVGSAHNIEHLPGSAHLLEHLVYARSKKFPGKNEFMEKIGLVGGYSNANTNTTKTSYIVHAPSENFNELLPDLIEHIRYPLFTKEHIDREATIILNESMKNKWWPGTNEIAQYRHRGWKKNVSLSKREVFGEKEDLETIRPATLHAMHDHYFTKGVYVVVGGNYDRDLLITELLRMKLSDKSLSRESKSMGWNNQTYHEKEFNDCGRYIYHLGTIPSTRNVQKLYAAAFISAMTTNVVQGPLYKWLREETSLTYNLDMFFSFGDNNRPATYELWFPFSSYRDAIENKDKILSVIERSVSDQNLLNKEVHRIKNRSLYYYHDLMEAFDEICNRIDSFGSPIGESTRLEILDSFRDKNFMQSTYEEIFAPEQIGEFLAMPMQK